MQVTGHVSLVESEHFLIQMLNGYAVWVSAYVLFDTEARVQSTTAFQHLTFRERPASKFKKAEGGEHESFYAQTLIILKFSLRLPHSGTFGLFILMIDR